MVSACNLSRAATISTTEDLISMGDPPQLAPGRSNIEQVAIHTDGPV